MTKNQIRKLAILGSTGSIGCQALEVVRANPESFVVEVLTAQDNVRLLADQAREFGPNAVVIGNKALYPKLKEPLKDLPIKVFAGRESICQITESIPVDMVLLALVGMAGLEPAVCAIQAGCDLALANKESLVAAGSLITALAKKHRTNIFPVDSEHSAIFQCLSGEFHNPIEKVILTASGGPFRGMKPKDLEKVTRQQALKHPNWRMGCKITIDSATLMNKGLEVIEAKWFFDLKPDQISVVIHPESIIHSMVQFQDGSIKAQMGLPDMRLPILYALTYPNRIKTDFERLDFSKFPVLQFEEPDTHSFPCLDIAYKAMERGGNIPAAMNAANEVAVAAFLKEKIGFMDIPAIVSECVEEIPFNREPDLNGILESARLASSLALESVEKINKKTP